MHLLDDIPEPPPSGFDATEPHLPLESLPAPLTDATVSYILAVRPAFDDLRQAAGQLAGVLVLAASGGRSALGHPMLALAESIWAEAVDVIRSQEAPAAGQRHHFYLRRAASAIGRALRAARHLPSRAPTDVDTVLQPLRAGFRALQRAAGELPGFEVVAFEQGCCASHPAVRGLHGNKTENAGTVGVPEEKYHG